MAITDMERGEILPNLNRWQAGYSFTWINDNKNFTLQDVMVDISNLTLDTTRSLYIFLRAFSPRHNG